MIVDTVTKVVDADKVNAIKTAIKNSGLKADIKTEKCGKKILLTIVFDQIFSKKLCDVIAYMYNGKY